MSENTPLISNEPEHHGNTSTNGESTKETDNGTATPEQLCITVDSNGEASAHSADEVVINMEEPAQGVAAAEAVLSMEGAAAVDMGALGKTLKDLLPDTVKELTGSEGQRIYVVGTAHFSKPSIEDVQKTIELVRPDLILLELCNSRSGLLNMDEQSLFEDCKNMSFQKARNIFQRFGYKTGMFYLLLVSLSASLTKKLGMVPGGEFRKAVDVAGKMDPMPDIVLIDRDIGVTVSRAFRALSPWGKLKLGVHMLFTSDDISEADVEKCKQKDVMELALAEIANDFPGFANVFIQERDEYLAFNAFNCFRMISSRTGTHLAGAAHSAVVVMGIGHVEGVVGRWGGVAESRFRELHRIPPESVGNRVASAVCRLALCGAVVCVAWRVLPQAAKGVIQGGAAAAVARVAALPLRLK